jgi:excisionase family DNA binding protein
MENQRMYKVLEFATALNISPKTVWAHIYAGKLAVVRIGRAVRIKQSELDRLLNAA